MAVFQKIVCRSFFIQQENKKCKHSWKIEKSIWPYKDGWGIYCHKCSTVLDTGLSKKQAEIECRKLKVKP